jgi:hypothetical protein
MTETMTNARRVFGKKASHTNRRSPRKDRNNSGDRRMRGFKSMAAP